MALTRRADGTQQANKVYAVWWNDFYDLLTGAMTDQPVTIANTITATRQGSTSTNTDLLFLKTTVSAAHQYNIFIGTDGGLGIWDQTNNKQMFGGNGNSLSFLPGGSNLVVDSNWATLKSNNVVTIVGFGGATAGRHIWVMTGSTDPKASDGLVEGDLVFKY